METEKQRLLGVIIFTNPVYDTIYTHSLFPDLGSLESHLDLDHLQTLYNLCVLISYGSYGFVLTLINLIQSFFADAGSRYQCALHPSSSGVIFRHLLIERNAHQSGVMNFKILARKSLGCLKLAISLCLLTDSRIDLYSDQSIFGTFSALMAIAGLKYPSSNTYQSARKLHDCGYYCQQL